MGTLLCRLFVLGQQQEPFRSPLWERLISRKLHRKPATAKCGLEKSARTVQTIHTSVPLRTTRKAYRSTCSSILVFAGPLAIRNIRTRLKPSHKDAPASRALRATFATPPREIRFNTRSTENEQGQRSDSGGLFSAGPSK